MDANGYAHCDAIRKPGHDASGEPCSNGKPNAQCHVNTNTNTVSNTQPGTGGSGWQ